MSKKDKSACVYFPSFLLKKTFYSSYMYIIINHKSQKLERKKEKSLHEGQRSIYGGNTAKAQINLMTLLA